MQDTVIYLPESKMIAEIYEGTGDNLLKEDIEEGYVDYAIIEAYKFENGEYVDTEGGQLMSEQYLDEKYGTPDALIKDCLELVFDNSGIAYKKFAPEYTNIYDVLKPFTDSVLEEIEETEGCLTDEQIDREAAYRLDDFLTSGNNSIFVCGRTVCMFN